MNIFPDLNFIWDYFLSSEKPDGNLGDAEQGFCEDCYFVAAENSIMESTPAAKYLKENTKFNKDGSYSIFFDERGESNDCTVTVTKEDLEVEGYMIGDPDNLLYEIAFEKYVKEKNLWIGDIFSERGVFDEGGLPKDAMVPLIGENNIKKTVTFLEDEVLIEEEGEEDCKKGVNISEEVINYLEENFKNDNEENHTLMCCGFEENWWPPSNWINEIKEEHAYSIVGIDKEKEEITLRDPSYGLDETFKLSYEEFKKKLCYADAVEVKEY